MTTLERATRALMRHHDIDPDQYRGIHGDYGDWPDAARAVLRELQNPGEAMAEAGAKSAYDRVVDLDAGDARVIFAAMIDAALFDGA